jgi:transposase
MTLPIYFKGIQTVDRRVAEATEVSERTNRIILKQGEEHEEHGTIGTPGKKHNVPKRTTETELNFGKWFVRRTTHHCTTIAEVSVKFKESIDLEGSSSSLGRIVKDIDFKWKMSRTNRRIISETH